MMEINYRKAGIEDSQEIARLSSQLGYPVESSQVDERLRMILCSHDHVVYAAELEEKLVGWIHAHGRVLIESPPFVEISGLIVDSDCRGQNIGKNLVSMCEEWAKSLGYKKIRVRTNGNRMDAIAFYTRIGYNNVKAQQVFDREL